MADVKIETADEKAATTEVATAGWEWKNGDRNVPAPYGESDGGRCRRGWSRFFRGALHVAGAFPSGELVGIAAVFVLHDGIRAGGDALGLAEQSVDGGREALSAPISLMMTSGTTLFAKSAMD